MLRMADDCDATETTTLRGVGAGDPGGMEAVDEEEEEVDVVGDSSVPMVTVNNETVTLTPSGSVCHTPSTPKGNAARAAADGTTAAPENPGDEENHRQPKPKKEPETVLIVRCDDRYLKTLPGIIRFLQVIFSALGLVCLTSAGIQTEGGYLRLPLAWHLRAFVFVSVCGFLTSLMVILLHVTGLIKSAPINWHLFDFISYSLLAFLYLSSTSLVASAIDYYQKLGSHVEQWTVEQLIVSVVLGYMCLFLYATTATIGYRRWRGVGQFRRYRFQNQPPARGSRSGSRSGSRTPRSNSRTPVA